MKDKPSLATMAAEGTSAATGTTTPQEPAAASLTARPTRFVLKTFVNNHHLSMKKMLFIAIIIFPVE